ncbi:MAG TPA: radical SAM protein, partial [Candidatus Aveggerthella excrementigallinarum]|nr:radical SAM protein [Candidatus Aveggerthella excrementigallinarum]
MKIAGLQKLTLLDYPGKTACTVFTPGCDFRCPFCHNADLVVPAKNGGASGAPAAGARTLTGLTAASSGSTSTPAESFPRVPEDELFAFLGKRHGLLDGVCVTGGEPTLQPDLADFLARVKAEGF